MAKALTKADEMPVRDLIDVRKLSSQQLLMELGRAITMTAESIAFLAECWVELERRGEDLSDLRMGLTPYLHDIAARRLAPESVMAFAGQKMVLRWLSTRPLEEQRRLAGGELVTLPDAEGGTRSVPVSQMTTSDLALAAGRSATRRRAPTARSPKPPLAVLAVSMQQGELDAIKAAAAHAGLPVSKFVRQALVDSGLLDARAE